MSLEDINHMAEEDLHHMFMQCCTSAAWAKNMTNFRPFVSRKALIEAADLAWDDLAEPDYLEAFEGHPRIGDVDSLQDKYVDTKALASGEQHSVEEASEKVLAELSSANNDYYVKFGFIFIVCATGKSAVEMLALLRARLPNDRATELANAIEEQRKIFQIRLDKFLEVLL